MATEKHYDQREFHWIDEEHLWTLLLGVTTVAGILLVIGIIKMFFL